MLKRRFNHLIILTLTLLLVFSFVQPIELNAEEITLVGATINRDGHVHTRALRYFGELIEEKSDGRLQLNVYPDAQLGGAGALYEGVIEGAIDIVSLDPGWFAEHHDEFDILDSFYLFESQEHYKEVMNKPGNLAFFEDLIREEPGLETIYYVGGFERNILSTFPIHSIEDLEGVNYRSREVSAEMDWWSALGANPVPIAYEEVYTAIQTGTVEGSQSSLSAILDMGFHEVADYIARTQHVFNINFGVMNGETFNNLDSELQEIVLEAGREAQLRYIDIAMEEEDDLLEELTEVHGAEITEPDTEPFVEASRSLVIETAEELGIEDVLAEIFGIEK